MSVYEGRLGCLTQGWPDWVKRTCSVPDGARWAYAWRRVHDYTEDTAPVMSSMRTIACHTCEKSGRHASAWGHDGRMRRCWRVECGAMACDTTVRADEEYGIATNNLSRRNYAQSINTKTWASGKNRASRLKQIKFDGCVWVCVCVSVFVCFCVFVCVCVRVCV